MDILERVNQIYQTSLSGDHAVQHYFHMRGISLETLKAFEVGFSSSYCLNDLKINDEVTLKDLGLLNEKGNERNWNRVMFPIRDEIGKMVGYNGRSLKSDDDIKYLLSPESMGFNKSAILYNLHQAKEVIKEKNQVFLVEGVFDVMAMHQMGIKNVVCSLGTSLSKEQINLLKSYTHNVIFAYDGDYAGFEASIKNSLTLSLTLSQADQHYKFNEHTQYLMMPEGKDPADLLKTPEVLKEMIHHSKLYLDYCRDSCRAHPEYEQVFDKIRNGARINKEVHQIARDPTTYNHHHQLLKRLDIVEVVGQYANLKKSGKEFKCLCPFHSEKTASLVVSPKKQIFKCFGCGEGGNALKFVAQIEGISYREAMNKLSGSMNKKERVRNETRRRHTPAQSVLER